MVPSEVSWTYPVRPSLGPEVGGFAVPFGGDDGAGPAGGYHVPPFMMFT